jgi:hypothetical protein
VKLAFLAPCALALAACARGVPPADARAASDTLRGRVEVVGSEPGTSIALLDGRGGAVTLEGERAVLTQLAALEVMVRGRPDGPRTFRVNRVSVRAAEGVPAVDGVLARDGGRDVLVMEDGRRVPLVATPAALRGKYGARIWLAGPLDRAPDTFGIIAEAP